MQSFLFHTQTKIIVGTDSVLGIADAISELNGQKALLITDTNLVKAGLIEPITSVIVENNLPEPVIFDQVPPDSDLASVEKAIALGQKYKCNIIIAIGGGSVIDTAKAANIGLTFSSNALEYEGLNTIPSRLNPLIAIPTTAGTGSEVSAVAMIKDAEQKRKLLFGSPFLFPDIAILDPNLLLSLPARLTAACGIDALTHSIEALTASTANYISDGLSLNSMILLFKYLAKATADGKDADSRYSTMVASTMAGMAFTNAGVGIVHALSHTIGSRYGTHHGLTNGVFLPYGMNFNLDHCLDQYALAWRFLTISDLENELSAKSQLKTYIEKNKMEKDKEKSAKHLIEAVKILLEECGIPIKLHKIGVPQLTSEDIQELSHDACLDPAIMFNSKEVSPEDLAQIIKEAY